MTFFSSIPEMNAMFGDIKNDITGRYEKPPWHSGLAAHLEGFRPGLTQTELYNHRRWLVASNFGFRK